MTPRKPPDRVGHQAHANTPPEAAFEWIYRALRQELPDQTADADVAELAEVLHAIALNWNVPIERLIGWIHADAPAKEWSGGEFRRWCELYRSECRETERLPESWPE